MHHINLIKSLLKVLLSFLECVVAFRNYTSPIGCEYIRREYDFTLATVKLLNLPRDMIRHADNEFCVQCMKLTTWYFISVYDKLIKSTQSVEVHTYTEIYITLKRLIQTNVYSTDIVLFVSVTP